MTSSAARPAGAGERGRASSLSDSPPLPPLPAKSSRPFPLHQVQSASGRPSRGSFDVGDRPPPPMDYGAARRTAGSFSGQTAGARDGPYSGASSQATTRNNSISSAQSTATVQQPYASAPATAASADPIPPYAHRPAVVSAASYGFGAAARAPPSIAPSTPSLGGYGGSQHAARASVSAYDAKAIYSSFDTLPPLPSLPTSQNPHPAPDPTSATAQFPHPSHRAYAVRALPNTVAPSRAADADALTVARRLLLATSALSSLFLHVLPCFNGDPLRNPIEALNGLVTSHITATFARYSSPARVLGTLTADLKDILGSGMLTLEAKLHSVDSDKLVGRVVEVWVFFWTAIVPYVEGIFLPLILDPRIVDAAAVQQAEAAGATTTTTTTARATTHAIDPRQHLLSLFLVALLHPHLPRILPLLAPPRPLPSPAHLARLQQMALILLTQSDPLVTAGPDPSGGSAGVVREGLESLLRSVGAAARARSEGGADLGGGGGLGGEQAGSARAVGLGGTPVKKAADNHRRGGWIAGKHRRGLSQAAAQLALDAALRADDAHLDPPSPTTARSSVVSATTTDGGGAGGTAKNEPSHLRGSAQTPRQLNVFRTLADPPPPSSSFLAGASSLATTATATYTLGPNLRARANGAGGWAATTADDDLESEAGYLDALRSPETPWSGASSPTHSAAGSELSAADELPADGQARRLPLAQQQQQQREGEADERRHSSPPTVSDHWAAIAPGTAS